jgi:glycosyltransferase involved in cell wall biosynthesis
MRDEGIRLFPELAERFVTLYPGFDLDEVRARAAAPAEPVTDGPYIVSVTRLEETQKDVGTLLRAFAILVKERHVAEQLVIVGEGRHHAELEALAKELGIGSQVVFAGFRSNPLPCMTGARVMALSSKFEGLPTALIEGLVLGKVLVASDCPTGPCEILDGGKAGLLTPVGDAQALAAALDKALHDSALRAQLQANALHHAETFSGPALGRRFSALAEMLVSA